MFGLDERMRDHIFQHDLTFKTLELPHKHIGQVDHVENFPHGIVASLVWHFHRYFTLRTTSEAKNSIGTGTREVEYTEMPFKLPELISGTLKVTPRGSPLILEPRGSQLPK